MGGQYNIDEDLLSFDSFMRKAVKVSSDSFGVL